MSGRPGDAGVAVLVLAAGGASRMGRPKQLLTLGGVPLVRRAVDAACGTRAGSVIVVVGSEAARVGAALSGTRAETVLHEGWAEGQASSLRAGLRAAEERGAEAVLVVLADQPAVSTALLTRVIEARTGAASDLVACDYGAALGPPALFGRAHFAALAALRGDRGARSLLRAADTRIPFPEGALDVDTPADYERARASIDEGD